MHNLSQLKRMRWAVRAVLVLGVAASVAANILHALPNPISQTIAAWPPLALLLTVELVSRIPIHRRLYAGVRIAATAAIAGIAAWISYWHMVGTAARYGEQSSSYLIPVTVDGLIVVASVSLVELAGKIRSIEAPEAPSAPLVTAERVVRETAASMPRPVSPGPVGESTATAERVREIRSVGRSGPQVNGRVAKSPLTGKVLLEEPPQV